MTRFLFALFLLCLALPARLEARSLALIVGNDSYLNIEALQKARADAEGYATLFEDMGFDVTLAVDQGRSDLLVTLSGFYDRIQPGDTVLFVYSGHGWSDGQVNYLIPTDIRAAGSQTLLAAESFALRNGVNGILDMIAARSPRLVVAIVDACRNNPFPADNLTRSTGLDRGLVRMQPPSGTFIAFSAGEGQTALDRLSDDDPSPYSVFTRVFLAELALPQDLQAAFKTTQQRVNAIAQTIGHPQRPAYYDEVVGAACLAAVCRAEDDPEEGGDGTITVADASGSGRGDGAALGAADPDSVAALEWQDFRDTRSVEALEAFARRHEGTIYAILARARITEIRGPLAAGQPPATDEGARPGPPAQPGPVQPGPARPDPGQAVAAQPSPSPDPAGGPALPGPGGQPGTGIGIVSPGGKRPAEPGSGTPGPGKSDPGVPATRVEPSLAAVWCARAKSATEQVICANPGLTALDLRMEVSVLGRHGALDPEARKALLQSQRVWTRQRESCGTEVGCIEAFYLARIEALRRTIWRASATLPGRL